MKVCTPVQSLEQRDEDDLLIQRVVVEQLNIQLKQALKAKLKAECALAFSDNEREVLSTEHVRIMRELLKTKDELSNLKIDFAIEKYEQTCVLGAFIATPRKYVKPKHRQCNK
jgi:hypothetical protein